MLCGGMLEIEFISGFVQQEHSKIYHTHPEVGSAWEHFDASAVLHDIVML